MQGLSAQNTINKFSRLVSVIAGVIKWFVLASVVLGALRFFGVFFPTLSPPLSRPTGRERGPTAPCGRVLERVEFMLEKQLNLSGRHRRNPTCSAVESRFEGWPPTLNSSPSNPLPNTAVEGHFESWQLSLNSPPSTRGHIWLLSSLSRPAGRERVGERVGATTQESLHSR